MPHCPTCQTEYSAGTQFCSQDGTALPVEAPDPHLGTTIGNYQILEKLGEGGMGTVYKAHHPSLGRYAAVKLLRPEYARDAEVLRRFFDEARSVNLIKHQHILEVFDLGQTKDGTAYLIAELLEGEDLQHRLKRQGRLSVKELQEIFLQVCGALSAAHEAGIVHRDLKPDNLFLCRREGRDDFVKIVDIGIAKLSQPGGGAGQTRTGMVMGTPHYMSPEQANGSRPVEARSDLYSLGVILYCCLSGAPPFQADTLTGVLMKHILEKPKPLRAVAPDVPAALEALVMRLLKKEPEQRFPSAAAVGEALRDPAILSAPGGPALPVSPGLDSRREARRKNLPLLARLVGIPLALVLLMRLCTDAPQQEPFSGAWEDAPRVDAAQRPKECQRTFEMACSCEPIRAKNCEALPRQIDALDAKLTAEGRSRKEIDKALGRSCQTLQRELRSLGKKAGCW